MQKPPAPIETRPVNHQSVVAKDNELVGHLAKYELQELRLIAYCLAHYDSRDADNRSFVARVEDLRSVFPAMDKKSAYAVVRRAMLGIARKPLELETDKTREFWHWFTGFRYEKATGTFTFRITPEIQPYLLGLEKMFTRYRLRDVYQFRSAATWKLYELLKAEAYTRQWTVELDQLRAALGVAGKYPRWSSLQQRIIDPALAEINEHSDLVASFVMVRRGRQAHRLVFDIEERKPDHDDNDIVADSPAAELNKALLKAGLHEKTAARLTAKAAAAGKVEIVVRKLPGMLARASAKNGDRLKYLAAAIGQEIQQQDIPYPAPQGDQVAADDQQAITKKARACSKRHRGNQSACGVDQGRQCAICQANNYFM